MEEGITLTDGIIGVVSLIMGIGLVSLHEIVKTRSLSDFFKATVKKEKPGSNLLYQRHWKGKDNVVPYGKNTGTSSWLVWV